MKIQTIITLNCFLGLLAIALIAIVEMDLIWKVFSICFFALGNLTLSLTMWRVHKEREQQNQSKTDIKEKRLTHRD